MGDTYTHFAVKLLFCELDFSQACHCFQMADPLSVQLLAFHFASLTMTCQRLAGGLNKPAKHVNAFVTIYRAVLLAILCTQLMVNIGYGVE